MNVLAQKSTNANLGNVVRLKLVPASQVIKIKNRNRDVSGAIVKDEHRLAGIPILCTEGYVTYPIVVPAGTTNYSERPADNLPEHAWVQEIAVQVPDDSPAMRGQLERYKDSEWLLIFEDSAGQVRLMGTKQTPVLMSYSFSTAGTKGRIINFSCTAKAPAYLLDSYADASLLTAVDDGLQDDYPV
jgi:hypothetical protein